VTLPASPVRYLAETVAIADRDLTTLKDWRSKSWRAVDIREMRLSESCSSDDRRRNQDTVTVG